MKFCYESCMGTPWYFAVGAASQMLGLETDTGTPGIWFHAQSVSFLSGSPLNISWKKSVMKMNAYPTGSPVKLVKLPIALSFENYPPNIRESRYFIYIYQFLFVPRCAHRVGAWLLIIVRIAITIGQDPIANRSPVSQALVLCRPPPGRQGNQGGS